MAEHNLGDDGRGLVDVRLLSPEDWRLARAARLTALRDAPGSFLPERPHESSWTEDRWRHSCVTGQWAVAQAGDTTLGLARLARRGVGPHLESIWTHPDHRRRGIASVLIRQLISLERARGTQTIFVWVIVPNPAAFHLYASLGFEPTHERHLLDGLDRVEERLRFNGVLRGG